MLPSWPIFGEESVDENAEPLPCGRFERESIRGDSDGVRLWQLRLRRRRYATPT
jgi:hypothetical protein